MSISVSPSELFYNRTDMDEVRIKRIVSDSLEGSDDGELFLEYCQSEALIFDDGRLKSATFDTTQGLSLIHI